MIHSISVYLGTYWYPQKSWQDFRDFFTNRSVEWLPRQKKKKVLEGQWRNNNTNSQANTVCLKLSFQSDSKMRTVKVVISSKWTATQVFWMEHWRQLFKIGGSQNTQNKKNKLYMCPWQWLGRSWRKPRLTAKLLCTVCSHFIIASLAFFLHSLALMAFVSNLNFEIALTAYSTPPFSLLPVSFSVSVLAQCESHKQRIMLFPAEDHSRSLNTSI